MYGLLLHPLSNLVFYWFYFYFRQTQVGNRRAILRRGESLEPPPDGPQKGALVAVPLFHVTGLTSYSVRNVSRMLTQKTDQHTDAGNDGRNENCTDA